ncbi:Probable serine/threonine-protein kinase abkC [Linum grandiflorum]
MSRSFSARTARKIGHSLLLNQNISLSGFSNGGGAHSLKELTFSQRRFYYQQYSIGRYAHFTRHTFIQNLNKSTGHRSFHSFCSRGNISNHALIAWKRLSQMCACNVSVSSPLTKAAGAVSLSLVRSNLLAPSIIAFILGELALGRKTAEAEPFWSENSLYTPVHRGQFVVASLILCALEGIMLLVRALYLAILFLPCLAMAPFADSLGMEFRKTWLHVVYLTLENAGPAFIKWGQWAATRPDLFPQDLCSKLTRLHSKAPAHSFPITKRTIENAFGRRLHDIFEEFEEEPIASGSVAQVHRAVLKYRSSHGEVEPLMVAVKVRHPNVGQAIKRDFTLINFVGKISSCIPTLKWLRLDESLQQFAVFMMSQVDLAREAASLSRFNYNFRNWKDVSFPRPLYPLVHPAVLVETYERGESIVNYVQGNKGDERVKSALAHTGTHALLKMLLVDNFVHADMHPGNILVRTMDDGVSPQLFRTKPHLVFLDVGMTAELHRRDRVNLLDFFKAVAIQDGRTAAECTLRLSKRQRCPDPGTFIQEVDKLFSSWEPHEGKESNHGNYMQQLLESVRRHKVNIDGHVCTVIVTTLVLEGWQRKLDSTYNTLNTLQTLLFKVDWAESLSYTIEGLMAP